MSGAQVFVGVGGGSGSGKSTITGDLASLLAQRAGRPLSIHVIHQDQFFKPVAELPTYYSDYHGAPRPDFNRPDSFRVEEMVAHCEAVSGHDVVILEGILALYYPALRCLMDVRCYVDTPLQEMLIRRTRRNLAVGYGGPYEEIAHYNLECITPQHQRYNAPTARFATVIIPNGAGDEAEKNGAMQQAASMILERV
jgi:uridine kinase